jgi:hypothetical protein
MSEYVRTGKVVPTTNQDSTIEQENDLDNVSEEEREARRQAVRENAKRVLRESGLAEMLLAINKNLLKGRGKFEEYDSMVLLKWGTFTTRRHLWIEVNGNTIRFRLAQHLKCSAPVPLCDGEYHTFTGPMWANHDFLAEQLRKYYEKPVAESSDD